MPKISNLEIYFDSSELELVLSQGEERITITQESVMLVVSMMLSAWAQKGEV